ncbi:uncharacterized protein LOC126745215 [Anthonomus grandis grandis]|uniref:uncharacterized protein LOC126745215 n=1 Tax=Anthonomus grandis grandis TaxID=2921223 RepID=UPI00216688FC|nr:uncharacterized protein LOC126745215 [Anthonomus grandis grandis]
MSLEITNPISSRLPENGNPIMESKNPNYGIPANYNPADHPPVKMRQHNHHDQNETQRKRRSKNRLSNRRSTGYVPPELMEEAMQMGYSNGQSDQV